MNPQTPQMPLKEGKNQCHHLPQNLNPGKYSTTFPQYHRRFGQFQS